MIILFDNFLNIIERLLAYLYWYLDALLLIRDPIDYQLAKCLLGYSFGMMYVVCWKAMRSCMEYGWVSEQLHKLIRAYSSPRLLSPARTWTLGSGKREWLCNYIHFTVTLISNSMVTYTFSISNNFILQDFKWKWNNSVRHSETIYFIHSEFFCISIVF